VAKDGLGEFAFAEQPHVPEQLGGAGGELRQESPNALA
jgi:hypothetical protein